MYAEGLVHDDELMLDLDVSYVICCKCALMTDYLVLCRWLG